MNVRFLLFAMRLQPSAPPSHLNVMSPIGMYCFGNRTTILKKYTGPYWWMVIFKKTVEKYKLLEEKPGDVLLRHRPPAMAGSEECS